MKPDPRKQFEKTIWKINQRIEVLAREIRNPLSVPLEKPFRRGFVRRYVLTKKAKGSDFKHVLEEIVKMIGTERYYWHRSFLRTRRQALIHGVEIDQSLKSILEYHRSRYPEKYPNAWFQFFRLEYWTDPYYQLRGPQWYYVFQNEDWLELKVEPYWMTHERIIDPAAIEELDELRAWLIRNVGSGHYDRYHARHLRYWDRRRLPPPDERRVISESLEADTRSQSSLRFLVSFSDEGQVRTRHITSVSSSSVPSYSFILLRMVRTLMPMRAAA